MKTTYVLGAILASSAIGAWTADRTAKTAFLLISAALAIYGLARLIG